MSAQSESSVSGGVTERRQDSPQGAEPSVQGERQRTARRAGLAAAQQMPTQQLAGMAVDHLLPRDPAVPACPDTA